MSELFDVYPLNDVTIARGQGSYVWDDEGRKYLDMYGGHAVISIGHLHPHWVSRLQEQLGQIAFYRNSVKIPIQNELAEKLQQESGKEGYRLFMVNSGAEANENALKLASFHTGKKKIVAFDKAFHGRTSLAVAATDNPKIVSPVNETDNVVFLTFNDEDKLREYFAGQGQEIAAVIVEGIQGVGGIREASPSFLQAIRQCCDEHNAVYIADSVQCGFGRSGKFFSHDIAEAEADIYTMAKGMGNGFPVSGILVHPKFEAVHGMLGTTFGGNYLACAAALAVLEVIQQDGLMEKARQLGLYIKSQLGKIEGISNIRGRGLMIGFDLDNDLKDLRKLLLHEFNIFTGEAKPNVVRLLPALNLTRKQADEFIESLTEAIAVIREKAEA